ncbi:copper resistance protein CopC [uncultured Friedmanniella sp.]|uniref:copper resistance CopC family protein n=1 Tax=uncultured Friedmanniella sp. TaxID=335381 RepID=UPI0035C99A5C
MSRPAARPLGRLLLVVLGAAITLVVAAGPASAHDVLASTTPANGSTEARVPASVVLTFDQPAIAMGTKLVVTGPSGEVQQGDPVLVDNTVTQPLQGGAAAGAYTVEWRVTSADGHPVSGTFTFTARAAGKGQPATTPATPGPGAATGLEPASRVWPWVIALAVLSFVVVGAVALGRRAARDPE